MINLYESYVAELGFELVTPGSAVMHDPNPPVQEVFSVENLFYINLTKKKKKVKSPMVTWNSGQGQRNIIQVIPDTKSDQNPGR